MLKIALACDHAGVELKECVKEYLQEKGLPFHDFGTFDDKPVDYPDLAHRAAEAVRKGLYERAILICGTGIGVAIAANKLKGIRAAQCHDSYSARSSRAHNDANVLTLGARVVGPGLALEIVAVFLETPFQGGRHLKRVSKIHALEE